MIDCRQQKRRLKISDDVFYKNLNKQRRTVIPNQRESDPEFFKKL
ncbi:hypothetical protein HMPREF3156_00870 [Neisseria sp. HMSC06F02]|nr:hypothetical protein HMPREF3156_00870 [Neisseria sp. HMSC06F02]